MHQGDTAASLLITVFYLSPSYFGPITEPTNPVQSLPDSFFFFFVSLVSRPALLFTLFTLFFFLHLYPCLPAWPHLTCAEVSPRRRILNVSRSVWKQANVASDLWEKLTARCVDRHRSDSFPPLFCFVLTVSVLHKFSISVMISQLTSVLCGSSDTASWLAEISSLKSRRSVLKTSLKHFRGMHQRMHQSASFEETERSKVLL